jgi:hypothetical protein
VAGSRRYADSNGYEKDRLRVMWPYRDLVIGALNDDMPFNQFTIEQIAGDMLPDATAAQRIASGFHRNTMLNQEGGIDVEEARWDTLVDRVNTTATVWLGSTIGCAQCHDHKFDPFSQRDYYRMLAFFDNVEYTIAGQAGGDRFVVEPQLDLATPNQNPPPGSARASKLTRDLRATPASRRAVGVGAVDPGRGRRLDTARHPVVRVQRRLDARAAERRVGHRLGRIGGQRTVVADAPVARPRGAPRALPDRVCRRVAGRDHCETSS